MTDTITSLAQQIRPFWLRDLGASSPSQSGGGSGMIAHALNGPYHTGTLDQSQAPWAVDTTTFTAHTSNPDAHHTKLHGIVDTAHHSGAGGLQYQIVGFPTNGGLGLLTPASSPGANAIVKTDGASSVTLVDLTVTSDLFIVGVADFGTNTIYEDASYLQVAGSKAVRFGQNIGNANWTVFNTGGASFGGSVDIVGSGDLYVAGSLGGAGGVLKTSGNRVGIACVPDSQFALDVAGPCRAQYFIGPHAIQVKDAIMICHYDGAAPYNTNHEGIALGHFGQVGTATGGVTYVAGKFGKAVQVAKATNNYFLDPSCEYDATLTQWSKYASGGTFTATRSNDVVALYGSYTGKLVASGGTGIFYRSVNMNVTTIAITAYVRKADKSAVTSSDCAIYYDADKTSTYTALGIDGWYRVRWIGTGTGTSVLTGLRVMSGKTLYVDGLQLEYGNASPFCDGSLGTEHTWSGTAHASTSARTAATLSYTLPAIALDTPLTIMAWVNLDSTTSENWQYLWYSVDDNYSAYRNSSGTLFVGTINCGTMPAGWVHIAFVTTGGTGTTAYVNGVSVGTTTITRAALTTFYVGSRASNYYCNGIIDDFALIGRELPANEIKAIYESNAPIFAETATVSWVATPSGLVWADERGLWMRGKDGNPVLGVYGGEAATYSWGGFTMEPGDLVLGYNAVGSSSIWWDKSSGKFGFYGAGSGTPQVEIATDGKLTAGAGKVKLDSTGFHALNASAVSTIDINEQGIYLGDGGARTTIGNWSSGNRIRAYNVGEVYEATPETYLDDSSVSRTLYPLVIRGIRQGNDAALIELAAVNTSNVGAFLRVGEGFRLKDYYGSPYNTNRVVHASATDIILESTNLQLRGLTTSAAAVGSYSGKIRIQIAGTNYYIPYYAS